MKKLLSVALVLALILSLGTISALAEVTVDGESKGTGKVTYDGDATTVTANASGDDLTVNGCVAGDESARDAVYSADSAKVTVSESVTKTGDDPGFAVRANSGSDVTVKKDITESGESDAIYTSNNGKVVVGGNVSESDDGTAIEAYFGSTVEVTGIVTESGGGNAINATGADTTVTVNGDVTESGDGNAIHAQEGATVIVLGSVVEKDDGLVINASKSTVKVGGDAKGAVMDSGAVVIVEGLVSGDIYANDNSATEVYIGQLNGSVSANFGKIHYLIGLADDSDCDFSDISMSGDSIIDPNATKQGVEKSYLYTTSASVGDLRDKVVTLKPADGKILTVSGFEAADVLYTANEDGTVTFLIGKAFKGGMQNLKLILTEKPGPGPDPDPTPVIYIVPASSVRTVEFTAPEGFEEGLITKLASADHAGLTIDKSLLAEGAEHSLKVTLDGKELPAEAFRFCINADGSLSLTLSNTYLFSLGDGTYDLVATVDGLEIPFTVAVAK